VVGGVGGVLWATELSAVMAASIEASRRDFLVFIFGS
jgi:hypothetical protein